MNIQRNRPFIWDATVPVTEKKSDNLRVVSLVMDSVSSTCHSCRINLFKEILRIISNPYFVQELVTMGTNNKKSLWY